ILPQRHIVAPRNQYPGVLAVIEDHECPQRRRFERARGDLRQRDLPLGVAKIEIAKRLERRSRITREMAFDVALYVAGKIEDARAALHPKHRLAPAQELDPGIAVQTVLLAIRNVADESVS